MTALAPLPKDKILFLATGLAGSLLIGTSAQFASANIADIQGGLHGSADETSWMLTVYTMSSFAGIVMSGPLFRDLRHRPLSRRHQRRIRNDGARLRDHR